MIIDQLNMHERQQVDDVVVAVGRFWRAGAVADCREYFARWLREIQSDAAKLVQSMPVKRDGIGADTVNKADLIRALDELAKPVLQLFRVTGFGIDGDVAYIEATDGDHAKAILKEQLIADHIDWPREVTHWKAEPNDKPAIIIHWQN